GFIAYQNREESQGMTLAFRKHMFFEFVPFHSDNFDENGDLRPGAEVLTIAKVQEGVEYAILITTCAGAWRYAIGDTVRFVNVDACEIKITGRIKHHLSICGEHLSVDNMNQALGQVAQEMGLRFPEFTVKGFSRIGQFGHIWHLACNQEANVNEIKTRLDAALSRVNDDYAVERKHVLTEMEVQVLPESLFLDFMDYRGKIGGQSKFPRVMTDALHQEWSNFVALRKP
ncbi:MAG: GH3 auxin-responsive promoter, partial [Bacteroidia bacterium]